MAANRQRPPGEKAVRPRVSRDTARLKEIVLEKLKLYLGVVTYACEAANIPRRTFYHWMDADEEFQKRVHEISEIQVDFVEKHLLENIKGGNVSAQIFYLKTKGKHRGYQETLRIGGTGGAPIDMRIADLRDDIGSEELKELATGILEGASYLPDSRAEKDAAQ